MSEPSTLPSFHLRRYWAFWLWQLLPLICVIVAVPPAQDRVKWPHLPFVKWLLEQQLFGVTQVSEFLVELIACQVYLLAFWLIWGSGRWYWRWVLLLPMLLSIFAPSMLWNVCFGKGKVAQAIPSWEEVYSFIGSFPFFAGYVFVVYLMAASIAALLGWHFNTASCDAPKGHSWQFSMQQLMIAMLVVPVLCGAGAAWYGVYAHSQERHWLSTIVLLHFWSVLLTAAISSVLLGTIAACRSRLWQIGFFVVFFLGLVWSTYDANLALLSDNDDFQATAKVFSLMTVHRIVFLAIPWFLLSSAGLRFVRVPGVSRPSQASV